MCTIRGTRPKTSQTSPFIMILTTVQTAYKIRVGSRNYLSYSQSSYKLSTVHICSKETLFYKQICLLNGCFINGLCWTDSDDVPVPQCRRRIWSLECECGQVHPLSSIFGGAVGAEADAGPVGGGGGVGPRVAVLQLHEVEHGKSVELKFIVCGADMS